jgi:hypothetical protein
VGLLVGDHVHEPILDAGIEPVGSASGLEADLDTGPGTPDAHWLAAADSDCYRRESCLRVESAQGTERDLDALAHGRQDVHAPLGARIDLRTLSQGFGNPRSSDLPHLGELMQPVLARIDVVALELVGGGVPARSVVDLIEAVDVLDMDGRPALPGQRPLEARCAPLPRLPHKPEHRSRRWRRVTPVQVRSRD